MVAITTNWTERMKRFEQDLDSVVSNLMKNDPFYETKPEEDQVKVEREIIDACYSVTDRIVRQNEKEFDANR